MNLENKNLFKDQSFINGKWIDKKEKISKIRMELQID